MCPLVHLADLTSQLCSNRHLIRCTAGQARRWPSGDVASHALADRLIRFADQRTLLSRSDLLVVRDATGGFDCYCPNRGSAIQWYSCLLVHFAIDWG